MQEVEIDIEKLREDLINYFEGAFFVGGFGAALIDVAEIEKADSEKLIKIAEENKFDLRKYIV